MTRRGLWQHASSAQMWRAEMSCEKSHPLIHGGCEDLHVGEYQQRQLTSHLRSTSQSLPCVRANILQHPPTQGKQYFGGPEPFLSFVLVILQHSHNQQNVLCLEIPLLSLASRSSSPSCVPDSPYDGILYQTDDEKHP